MATDPNFPAGVWFIEDQMRDILKITRDTEGIDDDVLNLTTGELERQPPDTDTKYSGIGLLKPLSQAEVESLVGGHAEYVKPYRVMVPITVTDVRQGDFVVFSSASLDSRLAGRPLRVFDVSMGTNRTYRSLIVEDMTLRQLVES